MKKLVTQKQVKKILADPAVKLLHEDYEEWKKNYRDISNFESQHSEIFKRNK